MSRVEDGPDDPPGATTTGRRRVSRADVAAHAQVSHRQHVRPPEGKDQEHVRGPDADALDVCKRRDHLFIAHLRQPGKINLAADGVLGQIANVTEFLP